MQISDIFPECRNGQEYQMAKALCNADGAVVPLDRFLAICNGNRKSVSNGIYGLRKGVAPGYDVVREGTGYAINGTKGNVIVMDETRQGMTAIDDVQAQLRARLDVLAAEEGKLIEEVRRMQSLIYRYREERERIETGQLALLSLYETAVDGRAKGVVE